MNLVDLFKKGLKCYLRQEYTFHNDLDNKFNVVDVKAIFVADIFDITTYDHGLSIEFGKTIIEVMEVINNRKNFEYMDQSRENYKKFILVANLLDHFNWIEWGTSIRGCWFNRWDNPYVDGECYDMKEKIDFDEDGKEIGLLIDYLKSDNLDIDWGDVNESKNNKI